jgi:hypothetical protein
MPWNSLPSHTGPNAVPAAVAGWRDHSLEFCRNFYLRRFEVCSSSHFRCSDLWEILWSDHQRGHGLRTPC